MDGAGWHTTDTSAESSNLTIIKLPPYSPELNPIEQVWSWLRQHKLANQAFTGYDDIVDKCSRAWCDFIAQVDLVKNLCSSAWIELVKLINVIDITMTAHYFIDQPQQIMHRLLKLLIIK